MAVSMTKHFWNGSTYADIAKIVYTSANFDSPAVAGTRSHTQPGGKYIATWYEAVDYMYRQKENQDYFNNRYSMESFFGLLELREDFDLDRDSSAQFKTEYNSNYFINNTIDYIYLDKNNYAKVSTNESFLTVSGISIDFIVPDHTDNLFFNKTNTIWWNSTGLNNDELLDIYISYNNVDWYLLSDDVRNVGNFSFTTDYLKAKGFDDNPSSNQFELLPATKVYTYLENENDVLVYKGAATLSAIFAPGTDTYEAGIFFTPVGSSDPVIYVAQVDTSSEVGNTLILSADVTNLQPGIEYEFMFCYYVTGEASPIIEEGSKKYFTTSSQYQVNTEPYITQAKLKITYLDAYEAISESFYIREETFSSATKPVHEITYSPEVVEVPYSPGTPYQPYVPPSGDRADTEVVLSDFTGSYSATGDIHFDKYNNKLYRCESDGLYEFDFTLNKWSFIIALPFTTTNISITVKNNCVYVMGIDTGLFYKYDVAGALWSQLISFTQEGFANFDVEKVEVLSTNEDDGKLFVKFLDGYNGINGGTEPDVRSYEDFDECYVYSYDISADSLSEIVHLTQISSDVGISDSSLLVDDVISERQINLSTSTSTSLITSSVPTASYDSFIGPITCTTSGNLYRHEEKGLYNFSRLNNSWEHVINSPMPSSNALIEVDDYIYIIDGVYFYRLKISTNEWEQLRDISVDYVGVRGHKLYYFNDSPDELYMISTEALDDANPIAYLNKYDITTGYWSNLISSSLESSFTKTSPGGSFTNNNALPFAGLYKDGVNSDVIYIISLAGSQADIIHYVVLNYVNLSTPNTLQPIGGFGVNLTTLYSAMDFADAALWDVDDYSAEVLAIDGETAEFIIVTTQTRKTSGFIVDHNYQFIRGKFTFTGSVPSLANLSCENLTSDLGIITTVSGIDYSDPDMVTFRETLGPKDLNVGVAPVCIRLTSDEKYIYMAACRDTADTFYDKYFYRVPFAQTAADDVNIDDWPVQLPGSYNISNNIMFSNNDVVYSIGRTSGSLMTATITDNTGYTCTLSEFTTLSGVSPFGEVTDSSGPYTFGEKTMSNVIYDANNNVIFIIGGNDTYNFGYINLNTNSYTELAQPPWLLKTGNTAVVLGNYVYLIQGANSSAFGRYSILLDSWEQMQSLPSSIEAEWPILCSSNNTNYLYLVNNFDTNLYLYNISSGQWSITADIFNYEYYFFTDMDNYYFKTYFKRYNMLYLIYDTPSGGFVIFSLNVDTLKCELVPGTLSTPSYTGFGDHLNNVFYRDNLIFTSVNYELSDVYNSQLYCSNLYLDYSQTYPLFLEYQDIQYELYSPILFLGDTISYVYSLSMFSSGIGSSAKIYEHIIIKRIDVVTGDVLIIGTSPIKYSLPTTDVLYNVRFCSLSGDIVKVSSTKFEFLISATFDSTYSPELGFVNGVCFRGVIDFSDDFLSFDLTPVNTETFYYDIHQELPVGDYTVGATYITKVTSDSKFFYMSVINNSEDSDSNYFYRLPLKTAFDSGTSCSGVSYLPLYIGGSVFKASVVSEGVNLYSPGSNSSSCIYTMDTTSETDYAPLASSSLFGQVTDLNEGPYIFDDRMIKNSTINADLKNIYLLGDYFIAVNLPGNIFTTMTYPDFDFDDSVSMVYVDGFIYVSSGRTSNVIHKYEIDSGLWTTIAPFPTSLVQNNIICKGDSDYFLYLFNSGDSNMYRYNISSDTWLTMTDFFNNGVACPTIYGTSGLYKDGTIYFMIVDQLIAFDIASMTADYFFSYNYSSNNFPTVIGNYIYTNTGDSLIKQALVYSQSDPIEEVIEVPEVQYVPYRAEIPYSAYIAPTYSGSNYVLQNIAPTGWEFSTDLTSPDSVIMNFDVNFSTITGDGIVPAGTLMYHQFSGTVISKGSATPIDRYHCGENSIIFEATFGEAYDCRLTAWDDDTHSTISNKVLSESHYRVDAAVYRTDSSSEAYNPLFTSSRSLVYPPCNNKILKGNESYYGDFDFIYAIETSDNGEFLAFIPRLEGMDETFVAGNYDFITTLHYEYT